MGKPDIHRLIAFQKLLVSFGAIKRASYLPGTKQRENDVEHSYFLAMAAWFLAPHFPHLDAGRMIRLALAHDMVEVHSGDTFVYGSQELIDSKPAREKIALEKLQKDWSDFPEMTNAIQEYAERSSEESKFVYALDKMLPPMVNYLADGKVWQENAVTIEMFQREKEKKIPSDSLIYPYYREILSLFKAHPGLFSQHSNPKS